MLDITAARSSSGTTKCVVCPQRAQAIAQHHAWQAYQSAGGHIVGLVHVYCGLISVWVLVAAENVPDECQEDVYQFMITRGKNINANIPLGEQPAQLGRPCRQRQQQQWHSSHASLQCNISSFGVGTCGTKACAQQQQQQHALLSP